VDGTACPDDRPYRMTLPCQRPVGETNRRRADMSTETPTTVDGVVYPESDGKPMADNTLQWDWMVKIVGELRQQYAGQEVFVAGDLFWYPVRGNPRVVVAPDALVAFGRPPGYRGSYKQWIEGGIAPQVVFEVLSPNNTADELADKLEFYDRHGVEEYYFINPYRHIVEGYVRRGERLARQWLMNGFVSPRLGVRFEENGELVLYTPDGRPFQTREEYVEALTVELSKTAAAFEEERERAIAERDRADAEQNRADTERERANTERDRADRTESDKALLLAKLRELGIDPDAILRPAG
jgi:Putative restriction endonuclease